MASDECDRLDTLLDRVIATLHALDRVELLKMTRTIGVNDEPTSEWADIIWQHHLDSMLLLKSGNAKRIPYLIRRNENSSYKIYHDPQGMRNPVSFLALSLSGILPKKNDTALYEMDQAYGHVTVERRADDYVVPEPLPDSYETDEAHLIELMELIAHKLEYDVPKQGGRMTKTARQ